MNTPPYVTQHQGNTWYLHLWVQPKATKSAWVGIHGNRIKIRLNAPPIGGQANRELIRFLAHSLRLSRKQIEIVAGLGSRGKVVCIHKISGADLLARLREILCDFQV